MRALVITAIPHVDGELMYVVTPISELPPTWNISREQKVAREYEMNELVRDFFSGERSPGRGVVADLDDEIPF